MPVSGKPEQLPPTGGVFPRVRLTAALPDDCVVKTLFVLSNCVSTTGLAFGSGVRPESRITNLLGALIVRADILKTQLFEDWE